MSLTKYRSSASVTLLSVSVKSDWSTLLGLMLLLLSGAACDAEPRAFIEVMVAKTVGCRVVSVLLGEKDGRESAREKL